MPMQFASPDGDISLDGWTRDTGGTSNIFTKINTTTGDTTDYITTVNDNDEYVCTLSSVSNPVTNKNHSIVFVGRDLGIGSTLTISLMQGGATISTTTGYVLDGTPTQYTFDLPEADIAGITDYTNLRLKFRADINSGNAIRVYEAYLLVPGTPQNITMDPGLDFPALGNGFASINFTAYLTSVASTSEIGELLAGLQQFIVIDEDTEYTSAVGGITQANFIIYQQGFQDASWVPSPKIGKGYIPIREFELRANRGLSFRRR